MLFEEVATLPAASVTEAVVEGRLVVVEGGCEPAVVVLEGGCGAVVVVEIGCLTLPRRPVGVDGLDLLFAAPLPRVGVVTTGRAVGLAALDGLDTLASLIGGFTGFTNVPLAGLTGPTLSRDLLGIFFPGCISPEDLVLLVIVGALVFLGTATPVGGAAFGTFCSLEGLAPRGRFVSPGFLTCEGRAEGTADGGRRLFSFDGGFFTTCTMFIQVPM